MFNNLPCSNFSSAIVVRRRGKAFLSETPAPLSTRRQFVLSCGLHLCMPFNLIEGLMISHVTLLHQTLSQPQRYCDLAGTAKQPFLSHASSLHTLDIVSYRATQVEIVGILLSAQILLTSDHFGFRFDSTDVIPWTLSCSGSAGCRCGPDHLSTGALPTDLKPVRQSM
jgi:hypothetical protein